MDIPQHRGVVVAQRGVVCASQPLAVSAGLHILQRGGTFADAAIAASAVLCVVEPYASHLGGDAFMVVYDADTCDTTALNGSGAAPSAATRDQYRDGIPLRGLRAAAVPGLVDAWFALHERWGSIPIDELLTPAITYASEGFPAGYRYCRTFADAAPLLEQFPDTAAALLTGGRLPAPGAAVVQPDLAWTLRQIASGGRDAFYDGPVAERLIRYSGSHGGLFRHVDLRDHRTQIGPPIRAEYRDYMVHGQPPVSQGMILLEELKLVEGFDLSAAGHNTVESIHLQVEAKRLAFADRLAFLGDPDRVPVPVDALLSDEYAQARRLAIDPERAQVAVTQGRPIEHDTTYFCVADRGGSAVSFIQSVFWGFGCGVVPAGTGFVLNNRMNGFTLDSASPNALQPGKRPAHTLNAYVVTDRRAPSATPSAAHAAQRGPLGSGHAHTGRTAAASQPGYSLRFVGGTPGGDVQVQSNLQVLCNLIDFGMNPQQAVEAPRWQHGAAVRAAGEPFQEVLALEERIPEDVGRSLAGLGHTVERIGAWSPGTAYQLIAVDRGSGAYLAGSDPRCDGHAAGF